ncbi:MAG: invasion associated locus B family protein [Pseudomonadota bacterium]
MRFLIILTLVLSLFTAAFAAFVLPREKLDQIVEQMPDSIQTAWHSYGIADRLVSIRQSAVEMSETVTSSSEPDGIIRRANGVPVGHWMYHCDRQAAPDTSCTITHQISEDGKIKFSWQIAVDSSGKMTARWQTATGIRIKEGIVLQASGQKPLTLPYSKCVSGYCESAAEINSKFIETLLKTDRTTATVQDSMGEPVTYAISVDGLETSLRMLDDSQESG